MPSKGMVQWASISFGMVMVPNAFSNVVQKTYCHIKQLGQWIDSML
jgi:hypothetical protein